MNIMMRAIIVVVGSDSSVSSSSDEHYLSVVPGVPLEVFQEELR